MENENGQPLLVLRGWSLVRDTPSGPITLLSEVDLTLGAGEWLGVLGPNGSGKTSLLRFLAGEDSPLAVPTGYICQDPDEQLVAATVAEELALGRPELPVDDWLGAYGLSGLAGLDPRWLSAGQKQRLTVAVAEAGGPRVLLCDEPTTLQDAAQATWLLDRFEAWRRRTGGALLWATQRPHEAWMCDRVIVLDRGRIAADGRPADVLPRADIARLLGWDAGGVSHADARSAPAASRSPAADPGGIPAARWEQVGHRYAETRWLFQGVELVIGPGQRIGVTGPGGCGKSTLLALSAGLLPPTCGRCYLGGYPLCLKGPLDLDHGRALLAPQFPEYFFSRTTVAAEIAVDPALALDGTAGVLAAAGLPAAFAARNPHELSSGQKRRLAVAMVVRSGRPLLLLDEPTAGLDAEGRRRVSSLLGQVPAGTAVVIASHDLDFLNDCGCEVYALGDEGLVGPGGRPGQFPLVSERPDG